MKNSHNSEVISVVLQYIWRPERERIAVFDGLYLRSRRESHLTFRHYQPDLELFQSRAAFIWRRGPII
jgi:hypothetical protein